MRKPFPFWAPGTPSLESDSQQCLHHPSWRFPLRVFYLFESILFSKLVLALGRHSFHLPWSLASPGHLSDAVLSYLMATSFGNSRQPFFWFSRRSYSVGGELLRREQCAEAQELNMCGFIGERKEGSKPSPEAVQPGCGPSWMWNPRGGSIY